MDKISPSEEQKNRMFDKAVSMAEEDSEKPRRRTRIKALFIGIVAAAAMVGTATAYADDIRSVFYRFFKDDSIISEKIIENIYEDTDGHVDFFVSRIVSDKMNTYAIVKYTALDDHGREWLYNNFIPFTYLDETDLKLIRGELSIEPGGQVSCMFGINDEIVDSTDKNSRVFRISCNAADMVFNTDQVKINYAMSSGLDRSVMLNISESLEFTDIKLDSSLAAQKSYIPTGVRLSPLGIMIYGKNNGIYDYCLTENSESVWRTADDKVDSVKIVTKDGSYIHYDRHMALGAVLEDEKDYDLQIFTTFFKEPIDTDDIAGIILDGVYFEF